jgi:hypothetical protein
MKISNLNAQAAQAASIRNGQTERASNSPTGPAGPAATPGADSVDLSAAAKTAQSEQTPGLSFARKALASTPELGEERIGQILQRIQSDYYSSPEVTRDIAQKVASAILPADQQ